MNWNDGLLVGWEIDAPFHHKNRPHWGHGLWWRLLNKPNPGKNMTFSTKVTAADKMNEIRRQNNGQYHLNG